MKSLIRKYYMTVIAGAAAATFVIYKILVLNIVWTGINITESDALIETILPSNAVQIAETDSQAELLTHSYFLVVPLITVFIAILIIGKKKGWFSPSRKGLILGIITSFLLMGLHELLHGLTFPNGSTVYIGIIKENLSGYAISTNPINIFQCIIYYLLPAFVLGIVPLVLFVSDRKKTSTFCWFCYGFALIGLVQTAPDWFGLFPILQQVPKGAIIQMSGWHTYWYMR